MNKKPVPGCEGGGIWEMTGSTGGHCIWPHEVDLLNPKNDPSSDVPRLIGEQGVLSSVLPGVLGQKPLTAPGEC